MPNVGAEICVLGGGPAGCVIARRLSQLGHSTVLVERSPQPQWRRAESLAPAMLQITDSLGLSVAVASATFRHESQALVQWESDSVRRKKSEFPSLLVERAAFDCNLRQATADVGVRVVAPAHTRAPQHLPRGGWLIPVKTEKGQTSIAAEFVVDARGKRRITSGTADRPRTVAMSAAWTSPDSACVETRIESGTSEWFWGSPMRDGRYSATVFVDAARVAGLPVSERHEFYRDLLSRSTLLENLRSGRMSSAISVRDATSRIASDLIGEDFIRTGEAAFSIDPLSSQGVQAAILSAVQGAAAVHTIRIGDDPPSAMAFYRERQQFAARKADRSAARLYHERSDSGAGPFWHDRAGMCEGPLPLRADGPQVVHPSPPFAAPPFVRLSSSVEIASVPVLVGDVVKRMPAICHPEFEQPVAYLGRIALAPLLADLVGGSATARLLTRWTGKMPPKTAGRILQWMCESGILEAGEREKPRPAP